MVANRVDTGPREIRLEYDTILDWRQKAKEEYKTLLNRTEKENGWTIETIPLRVAEQDPVDLTKMRLLEEVSLYKVSTGHRHYYGVYAVTEGWNPYRGGYKPGSGMPRRESKIGDRPFNFRITTGQEKLIQLLAKKIPAIKRKNRSERFRYFVEIGIDKVIQDNAFRDIGRAPIGTSIPTVEGVRLSKDYHAAATALQERYGLSDYKVIQLGLQIGLGAEVERLEIALDEDEITDTFF